MIIETALNIPVASTISHNSVSAFVDTGRDIRRKFSRTLQPGVGRYPEVFRIIIDLQEKKPPSPSPHLPQTEITRPRFLVETLIRSRESTCCANFGDPGRQTADRFLT